MDLVFKKNLILSPLPVQTHKILSAIRCRIISNQLHSNEHLKQNKLEQTLRNKKQVRNVRIEYLK